MFDQEPPKKPQPWLFEIAAKVHELTELRGREPFRQAIRRWRNRQDELQATADKFQKDLCEYFAEHVYRENLHQQGEPPKLESEPPDEGWEVGTARIPVEGGSVLLQGWVPPHLAESQKPPELLPPLPLPEHVLTLDEKFVIVSAIYDTDYYWPGFERIDPWPDLPPDADASERFRMFRDGFRYKMIIDNVANIKSDDEQPLKAVLADVEKALLADAGTAPFESEAESPTAMSIDGPQKPDQFVFEGRCAERLTNREMELLTHVWKHRDDWPAVADVLVKFWPPGGQPERNNFERAKSAINKKLRAAGFEMVARSSCVMIRLTASADEGPTKE